MTTAVPVPAVPVTAVRMTGAAHRAELPLLVLGPSLGTSAATLWTRCAQGLTDAFDVLAWDLPGHGHNHAVPDEPATVAGLARGVLQVVDDVQEQRGDFGTAFCYAGVSVGGAVGLQLLLDHPSRIESAALICTGARLGTPEGWQDRIAQVHASGTAGMIEGSARRWFAEGFVERDPDTASALLHALAEVEDRAYIATCEALSAFDVRDRLDQIVRPVLAVGGREDPVATVKTMTGLAEGVRDAQLVVLDDVAHLAPAEAPDVVARLLREFLLGGGGSRLRSTGGEADSTGGEGRYAAGLAVRREVLGEAHLERSIASTTDLTRDFQRFITEYAWGGVWTRPGLDRRSRSMITLTALIARGHHEELALHLRAARTNGLSEEEISEVILHSAVYCGVPAANAAFRIAQQVLSETTTEGES